MGPACGCDNKPDLGTEAKGYQDPNPYPAINPAHGHYDHAPMVQKDPHFDEYEKSFPIIVDQIMWNNEETRVSFISG